MNANPSRGYQDEESYQHFVAEYENFIKDCQVEGYNSSSSPSLVGYRSPLQLALMISPLYLLVTLRLSTKSFHRRAVIDFAARLGPHKPPPVLAVENLIWDAIFRLAEGQVSVHEVLCDLADSFPWSDIDVALNCHMEKGWFAPAPRMFHLYSLKRVG